MSRLTDKTTLVTGAGRGIGAAIARRFAEEGAKVVVTDLDQAVAEQVADEVGGIALRCDVTDPVEVAAVFEKVAGLLGRLDVLVNNAGIGGMEGRSEEEMRARRARILARAEEIATGGPVTQHDDSTLELSDDEWRRMLAVHLDGTFFCCREALRMMRDQGSGSIVNLGSIMGTAGGGGAAHYCAAKAGVLGLTRALAREVVTRGIRVNAIAPGWIATEMTAPLGEVRALLEAQTPMGRFGDVDDVAWAAVYLASEEAKFVTGQVLSPNGGWHMSQ
ncbi:MAG TPA: SDR family NAD(P)-dependent oxidoreductase [Thermoanaerobaculia bacterium]|nr:SDR family NAD(P)-dependent oxidoreductase [Thermoanaerobaculia bacterium]